ncbi:hypothetical protein F2P81_016552 [Scophthalmus maximus]|uniref:C-type lectin domain-containing protein n=1 Tax=Scophthalmus maximus TaxID=52904 RepID=A0A6A4SFH1_SCOMX|nr:hypothetical protein F2P81_016552 [Scophthalmus maximus]
MNQLIKTVPSAGNSSEVWIGLFDEIKWRWSDGYTGSGADYRKWELSYNEPNFYEAGEFCVTIDNDRGWYDAFCTGQYPFMCYNGSMLDPHFDYVNEYMNWSDAQNYCREHFTDLATVRNDTENLKIHKLLTENKDSWIGLFRDPHFYWSDGSVFSFSYWYTDYNYLGSRTLLLCFVSFRSSSPSRRRSLVIDTTHAVADCRVTRHDRVLVGNVGLVLRAALPDEDYTVDELLDDCVPVGPSLD